jgi:leucyl aminopeptidase
LGTTQIQFIDITDHQDINTRLTPKHKLAIPATPTHQSIVNPLLAQIDAENFNVNLNHFSNAYRNRYYTSTYSVEASNWLFDTVSAIAANRSDVTVSRFTHTWVQSTVIARIQGTSANDEIVILGAHQDSIAPSMPTGIAPGADDDGSGCMGILEIFRVLVEANFRPQNSIEFHWYAAEEVGLLGSQAVALRYQQNEVAVRSMMELDMIAYNGKESTVGLITDYTDASTNAFVRALTDEYLQIGWTNSLCGYGCSDHASWTRYGYPSCFPFEAQFANRNPIIHTSGDTMSLVSIEHAYQFMRLAMSFAVELSYI